jgi:hypothetical protein
MAKKMTTQTKENKKIDIAVERINGETYLTFEVSPEIEKLWQGDDVEIRESDSWQGLKFYYNEMLREDYTYRHLLQNFNLRDDYGSKIISDGEFNIAFIRTVGGHGKIKIANTFSYATISEGVRNTIQFLKQYFAEYLKNFKVKGTLNIEL